MIGIVNKDYYYAARVYKQKVVKKQIEDDVKTMVYTMLKSDQRKLEVSKCESKEGYDCYSYCKNWEKKYCPSKNKMWCGAIRKWDEDDKEWHVPYVFYADSELGVYLEVLKKLLAEEMIFPAVI